MTNTMRSELEEVSASNRIGNIVGGLSWAALGVF
jgi:hypothetical protein